MKFNLIALGAIALCALQQQTFANTDLNQGELVTRDIGLAPNSADVATVQSFAVRECGGHCGGHGDLIGLGGLVDGVLHVVGDLLESVGHLVKNLLHSHGDCDIPVGHEHEGDHGSLDLGNLNLDDLVKSIIDLLKKLLGGGSDSDNLLGGVIGGLLEKILSLLEQVLKQLGLEIDLTDILDGGEIGDIGHCDSSSLNLKLVETILGLIKQVLGLVKGLTGNSESAGILCELLGAIGDLLSGVLGGNTLDNIDGLDGVTKRALFGGAKRFAARLSHFFYQLLEYF
ncbi:unnamed protein product [Cunninghamella blakesleeana]